MRNAKGKVLRRNNNYINKKFKIKENFINDDDMKIKKEDDDGMNVDKKKNDVNGKHEGSGSQTEITFNNNKKKMTVIRIKVLGVKL